MKIELAPMTEADIEEVHVIERASFSSPWPKSMFLEEIGDRFTRSYLVAKKDGKVIGYAGLLVILDDGHITNLAVAPAFKRQRVATRLVLRLIDEATERGVIKITLEVRESNQAAIEFYQKFGFEKMGTRKNYYSDTGEDAVIMWTLDIRSKEYQQILNKQKRS